MLGGGNLKESKLGWIHHGTEYYHNDCDSIRYKLRRSTQRYCMHVLVVLKYSSSFIVNVSVAPLAVTAWRSLQVCIIT